MSALLRLFRSFDARAMYFQPSEEGGLGPDRAATLLRDLDALHSDTKAKSSRRGGHLRAGTLLQKLPWQVRATTRITLIGPPTASLILLAVNYFEHLRAVSFDFTDFLAAYFLFAIPVGYVFGAVPALLAASLYCALFTADPKLLQRGPLIRACVAATCGGLASGVWFWEQIPSGWGIYALVGALVMATLSLRTPQLAPLLEKGSAAIGKGSSTKARRLPPGRVNGSGTSLDLSPFRGSLGRVGPS